MTELITQDELNRFAQLREDLFGVIDGQEDADINDGRMSITFPDYWGETDPEHADWGIYIEHACLGIDHEEDYWWGKTFSEALDAAEKDIRAWIAEQQGEPEWREV
jgi:hypothetical protein